MVSTFDAARRVRAEKQPAVDTSDNADGRFVMSLAEAEMVYARRKDWPDDPPDYYVVEKLDSSGTRIHFAPHWDGRKAPRSGEARRPNQQDRWNVTPADFRHCGPEPGQPPIKVRVSPLGEVTRLERD